MKPTDPAFPRQCVQCGGDTNGMSIRLYIATKALQGILANTDTGCGKEQASKHAFEYADALIAQANEDL